MNLNELAYRQRDPNQPFTYNSNHSQFTLVDFWKWNQSYLVENWTRGILAEFIVKMALGGQHDIRLEWDDFDLKTEQGIKVEVKSAAYIQAWGQKKYSPISFDIEPKSPSEPDENQSLEKQRHADIYVFCLLHHKDQETIEPMNLDQWTFYVVTKETLDQELTYQKSLGISTIESIPHAKCSFEELKKQVDALFSL